MSGAPVTTRCALLQSSSQCVRCLLFTSKLPVTRLYSRRLGLLVCRIRDFSNAFGRSPESHTNPVILLQRHRQLKINGQLYKCM